MLLIDAHAHLDFYDEAELDGVIARAKAAGTKAIICNGVNQQSNEKVLAIAKKYPDVVKLALGMYPTDKHDVDAVIAFIRKHKDELVAIGEVGMDFKEHDNIAEQQEMFGKIIDLAKELDKPLIVHSRKAEKEVIELLLEKKAKKVVLHCFCGKKKLVPKALEQGWSFTIPTNVVRSEQMQSLVNHVPLPQLLTETDCPYLSPFPEKKNEPAFVAESIKKIAEIKKMAPEEIGNIIFQNYQRMFL